VVARQQRGLPDWYLGAATDENARTLVIPLDFLAHGRRYEAQIYRDGPGASYLDNPTALVIDKRRVTAGDRIEAALAPGGGLAARFKAL
jgi:alpha-glucosidase